MADTSKQPVPVPISGTNLAAPVVPYTTADKYPTHHSQYGRGGWHEVSVLADLDTIPEPRRTEGMAVRVTALEETYIYTKKTDGSFYWKKDSVLVDDALSATSANPISNKAVATALQTLTAKVGIHTYTLDFGTGGELIQDVNMLGAATITRVITRNVARLFLTDSQGVRQEISLTGTLSIPVPADDILTWEIVRTNDDELACVGIKCELTND